MDKLLNYINILNISTNSLILILITLILVLIILVVILLIKNNSNNNESFSLLDSDTLKTIADVDIDNMENINIKEEEIAKK